MYDRAGARRRAARAALLLLAAAQGLPGLWALLWPAHFYGTYPVPGHPWVAGFPPYNEHLLHDTGAAGLALGVLCACAAYSVQPQLVRAAAASTLVFCVAHLVFHGAHLGRPFGAEEALQLFSLAAPVACAAVALLTTYGPPQRTPPTRASDPDSAPVPVSRPAASVRRRPGKEETP
ncbi:hypothetical protein [Streptomyces sp. Da 82-17]|uniref:hypothetical protein n=1 Tax=Streptomyces sp. Da 82-17 TaxID=3377116 RepID=UPI0038D3DA46